MRFVYAWLKIAVLGKENSFILQYAAMVDKQNTYGWNRRFILKIFGANFSHVELSMREL